MVIDHLNYEKFIQLLKDNGCEIVSDEYFETANRVIIKKDDINFPLRIKNIYGPAIVCRICEDLDITPPKDLKRTLEQLKASRK